MSEAAGRLGASHSTPPCAHTFAHAVLLAAAVRGASLALCFSTEAVSDITTAEGSQRDGRRRNRALQGGEPGGPASVLGRYAPGDTGNPLRDGGTFVLGCPTGETVGNQKQSENSGTEVATTRNKQRPCRIHRRRPCRLRRRRRCRSRRRSVHAQCFQSAGRQPRSAVPVPASSPMPIPAPTAMPPSRRSCSPPIAAALAHGARVRSVGSRARGGSAFSRWLTPPALLGR